MLDDGHIEVEQGCSVQCLLLGDKAVQSRQAVTVAAFLLKRSSLCFMGEGTGVDQDYPQLSSPYRGQNPGKQRDLGRLLFRKPQSLLSSFLCNKKVHGFL